MLYRALSHRSSVHLLIRSFLLGSIVFTMQIDVALAAEPAAIPGEYVVEFASSENSRTQAAFSINNIQGSKIAKQFGKNNALFTKKVTSAATISGSTSDNFCQELLAANAGTIVACSPNYILKTSATPNDSQLGSLWGMKGSFGIDAPRAWDLNTSATSQVVAVIDTGVDYNHPDLSGNVWTNSGEIPGNGRDDDGNGYIDDVHGINTITGSGDPMDDNGHGTHVSGTIGAIGNNNRGVVGVNWSAKIMGLKFLASDGSGSLANAVEAINYMVEMKQRGVNIRVVNNSWGGGGYSSTLHNAIKRANNVGIIFVAAAGNEANDNDASPSYPASYEVSNVVSVAAIDSQGNLASFSNYGATGVDIAAPGVDILSTTPGNRYSSYSGTSMATPHVAGALASLLSSSSGLSIDQAITRLYESGRSLVTLSGVVRTGRTLNLARMVYNETTPISAPTPSPECPYVVSDGFSSPDTASDGAPIVVSSDEFGFYPLTLPFSFPFHGEEISNLTISPNGVVYTRGSPSSMDYQQTTAAPKNSIAVLHSDLYPVGEPLGVRAVALEDRVVISWYATHYALRDGWAFVRMSIDRSGVIRTWYDFDSADSASFFGTHATVGIRGASVSSARTYSASNGRISKGKTVTFTPNCDGSAPVDTLQVDSLKISPMTKASGANTNINPGQKFRVRILGSGTGVLPIRFGVGGRLCQETSHQEMRDGDLRLTGKVPAAFPLGSKLGVAVDGHGKQSYIRVGRVSQRSGRSKRLSASKFNSLCRRLTDKVS